MRKNYVDDIPPIELDSGTDLTIATVLEIHLRKPDGTLVVLDAEVYQTTKARHITVSGELDLPGLYKAQIYAELPEWSGLGETFEFRIYSPYG